MGRGWREGVTAGCGWPQLGHERGDYGTGLELEWTDLAVQQQAGGIDRSPECLENRRNMIRQMAD